MRDVPLIVTAVFIVVTGVAVDLWADNLATIEGETITGKVVSVAEGQVTVEMTDGDEVNKQTIPLSNLLHIRLVPVLSEEGGATVLLVDNLRSNQTKKGQEHEESANIKLREGHHQFTLVYWQKAGSSTLAMEAAGPGGEFTALTPDVLFRVDDDAEVGPSKGMDDEEYRLPEEVENPQQGVHYEVRDLGKSTITSAAELRGFPQVSAGRHGQLDLSMKHPDQNFAVIFRGFFGIQAEGEYGAKLKSTGSSQLFLGPTPAVLLPSPERKTDDEWLVRFRHAGRVQGDLKSWKDAVCVVTYDIGGKLYKLSLPATELTELWSGSMKPDDVKAEREDEPTDLDSVYAKTKGDRIQRVSGTVLGIADKALRFEYKEKERTISLDRVVGIVMRKVDAPESDELTASQRFDFLHAASIPGRLTDIGDDTMTLELPWGESLEARRDDVRKIVVAKGRFQSLSDLAPLEVTQTPFFDRVIPMRIDQSLTGETLQIGEKTYDKGLCLPSRTVLSYALDGEFDRFRCELGLQETDGDAGNATVRILADDEVLLDIEEMTGEQDPQEVDLDVSGRQRLTLLVDFGKNLHIGDHVVWANAHLLRSEATP